MRSSVVLLALASALVAAGAAAQTVTTPQVSTFRVIEKPDGSSKELDFRAINLSSVGADSVVTGFWVTLSRPRPGETDGAIHYAIFNATEDTPAGKPSTYSIDFRDSSGNTILAQQLPGRFYRDACSKGVDAFVRDLPAKPLSRDVYDEIASATITWTQPVNARTC